LFYFGFLGVILGSTMKTKARSYIRHAISNVELKEATVKLNGVEISHSQIDCIIDSLKNIQGRARHSNAIDKVNCEIVGSGVQLSLVIGRDAHIKNEYWVYWPKYRYTKYNTIGAFYSSTINSGNR
jgi:hypothetical protein